MKKPFVTKEQLEKIAETYPTPFHLYDEGESGRMQSGLRRHLPGIRATRSILR